MEKAIHEFGPAKKWEDLVPNPDHAEDPGKPAKITLWQRAADRMSVEVDHYNAWINNDVVYYVADDLEEDGDPEKSEDWSYIDSCHGFLADTRKKYDKQYEYALDEARGAVDNFLKGYADLDAKRAAECLARGI